MSTFQNREIMKQRKYNILQ